MTLPPLKICQNSFLLNFYSQPFRTVLVVLRLGALLGPWEKPTLPQKKMTKLLNTGLLKPTFEESTGSFVSVEMREKHAPPPPSQKSDKTILNDPEGVSSNSEGGFPKSLVLVLLFVLLMLEKIKFFQIIQQMVAEISPIHPMIHCTETNLSYLVPNITLS